MQFCRLVALLSLAISLSFGQLTTDQKLADFQVTAGLFAKSYGPLKWKQKLENFDLLDTAPWAAKVRATKNDIEFFEVMIAYLNKLNDAHSGYFMPSTFVARLNFSVDIYEGKLLVDFINRTRLPASEYPVAVGYELVSIDGEDATKLLDFYSQYNSAANTRSTRRNAAALITTRPQIIVPSAPNVPEISTVVFRRYDGTLETYRIPWSRSGLAWAGNGKLPVPGATVLSNRRAVSADADEESTPEIGVPESPSWMKPLERLWNCRLPDNRAILNFGAISPVFQAGLPGTFVQRLGRLPTEFFFSGTYSSGNQRIGLIRIPSFAPFDQTTAVTQFAREIAFMQENTDGLVIDETRNPGGRVDYMHTLLSLVFHYPHRGMAFEVRPTSRWLLQISSAYESAKAQGAPKSILDLFQSIQDALVEANRSGGLTVPIPLDSVTIERQPARDNDGNLLAYTKPMIVLIDEFSASGGDAFAAVIQDNGRGPLFGFRTMGAGGNVTGWNAGSYSEAGANLTESLMSRKDQRAETGTYPLSPYVENVGVRPDIEYDYMTRDNLFQNGKPFVDAFTAAMVEQIRRSQ